MDAVQLIRGSATAIPLRDESVQCVVTSPPYWGLRKYAGEQELVWGGDTACAHEWATERYYTEQTAAMASGEAFSPPGDGNKARLKAGRWRETNTCVKCGAWRGAYGLEPTVGMYVQHTVEILREIRRVLRPDGVCFWNLSDSYFATGVRKNNFDTWKVEYGTMGPMDSAKQHDVFVSGGRPKDTNLKAKDLCLIPQRVALAAQADGWWVRSDIIWAKPNPMPESCRDRPTDAYEHILMLTKSARYFWDAEAVAERIADSTVTRVALAESRKAEAQADIQSTGNGGRAKRCESARVSRDIYADERDHLVVAPKGGKRNLRNVWAFPTQPYSGAHFATFPEELPRRCILAATSAKGACRFCGAPWERVTQRGEIRVHPAVWSEKGARQYDAIANDRVAATLEDGSTLKHTVDSQTIGWMPTCLCPGQHGRTVPCVVLDPFAGSGTVGRVARGLNRRAVLLDIAYTEQEYLPLAQDRCGLAVHIPVGNEVMKETPQIRFGF